MPSALLMLLILRKTNAFSNEGNSHATRSKITTRGGHAQSYSV